jgi:hypothetical protein
MKIPVQINWVMKCSYTSHYELNANANSTKSLIMEEEDLIVALKHFTTIKVNICLM